MEGNYTTFVAVFCLVLGVWALFTSKKAHGLPWPEFFREKM